MGPLSSSRSSSSSNRRTNDMLCSSSRNKDRNLHFLLLAGLGVIAVLFSFASSLRLSNVEKIDLHRQRRGDSFKTTAWTTIPAEAAAVTDGKQQSTSDCGPMPVDSYVGPTRKPLWVPSFPGSGSEMLREIVRAISGLESGNVYPGDCFNRNVTVVTCKTHWPKIHNKNPFNYRIDSFHHSAFLLFRNPSKAIPSFFNRRWELVNKMEDHSVQAPEDAWRKWRDEEFDHEIWMWRNTFTRWSKPSGPYPVSLYLPYELLSDEETGPVLAARMAQEFRKANFTAADDDRLVQCLWRRAVKDQPTKKRKEHSYTPSFTPEQQETMLSILDELMDKLSDEKELLDVFKMYKEDIGTNLKLDLSQPKEQIVAIDVPKNASGAPVTTNHTAEMQHGECGTIPFDSYVGPKRKPLWVPGYPGSGSEMLREIVRAITGMESGNIYEKDKSCFSDRAVTCKTHWPLGSRAFPFSRADQFHSSAFLLFRNPSRAIPSLFNFLWEGKNHHSMQGPEEKWRKWRDKNFNYQLFTWRGTLKRWKAGPYRIALYLPYERLLDDSTGPVLVQNMAQEFRKANFTVAKDESLECLWRRVVKEKPTKKRTAHSYTPSFTLKQQQQMLRVVNATIKLFSGQKDLVDVFLEYKEDIRTNLRIDLAQINDTLLKQKNDEARIYLLDGSSLTANLTR